MALVSAAYVPVAHAAVPAEESSFPIDREAEDCSEWIPESYVTLLDDSSSELFLEVHVLLDGISVARGQQIMARVGEAYDPLNITIVSSFEEVAFTPDSIDAPPWGSGEPAHSGKLMQVAKDHMHGARPWGTDLVYVLTATPIKGGTAGFADCIGGVRYATRAFAVGEASRDGSDEHGWFRTNTTAKIAAYEIAHLLGAHHHYANCVEGDKAALAPEMAPCSMMFNDVGLISLRFSTVEAAVVRGHVARFAADRPIGPEPAYARTVSLKLNRQFLAIGTVGGHHSACVGSVPVEVELEDGGSWFSVGTTKTNPNGTFRVPVEPRAGAYRAVVPSTYYVGARSREACSEAVSPSFRRP